MKAAIWVLNINDYQPDIFKHTFPSIQSYAEKIGAELHVITERKFPDYPITLEKTQIWELGKDFDVNILIDADILVSPKFPDITDFVLKDPIRVLSFEQLDLLRVFENHPAFDLLPKSLDKETGQPVLVGPSGSFIVTTKATHDLWKPLGLSSEEIQSKTKNKWLVDEYTFAVNLGSNGYSSCRFLHLGIPYEYLHHVACTSLDIDMPKLLEKVEEFKKPERLAVVMSMSEGQRRIYKKTKPFAEQYAKKIGADFVVKKNDTIKVGVHAVLSEYDRVIHLTADSLVRPDTPNLFDVVPLTEIGLFDEGRYIPKVPELNSALTQLRVPEVMWSNKFYNFEVFVASKAHRDLFRTMPNAPVMPEDLFLNIRLTMEKPPIFTLPYKYNYAHYLDKRTGDVRHSAYVINYTGGAKNLGMQNLFEIVEKDVDVWDENAPDYAFKKNIAVIVSGGLGDQVAAEPVARYVAQHLYKGENVVILTDHKELFTHIGVPVYLNSEAKNVPELMKFQWFEMHTLRDPQQPIWDHMAHTLVHAVDWASICATRFQLPLEHKKIQLPEFPEAKESVYQKLGDKNQDLVVVHPGKGWPSKTLPTDVWQSYIDALVDAGKNVVIIGKTLSEGQGTMEVDASRCTDLRNKLSIAELVELIRASNVLITNDSSPVHIAGASECWIGLIATCKHPDYILPHRKDRLYWRALNLGREEMYFDYDRRATTIDGSQIDAVTDTRIRETAPTVGDVLDFVAMAEDDYGWYRESRRAEKCL